MASRKELNDIAEAIGTGIAMRNVVSCLCHVLKKHNPAFDEVRFTTIINRTAHKIEREKELKYDD